MHRVMFLACAQALLSFWPSAITAAPPTNNASPTASAEHLGHAAAVKYDHDPDVEGGEPTFVVPAAPVPDSRLINKNRFLSFSNPEVGPTAMRVTFVSLHHVEPPYTGGPSVAFTLFEGQSQYVGAPTRYVESRSSGAPFYASKLQCDPYYQDWSTVGLLHVTGEAIVPSSIYDVETLAATCRDDETQCSAVSPILAMETSRWGDIVASPDGDAEGRADFADISALVDKFKNAPGAPMKSTAMLAGSSERGMVNVGQELSLSHVAQDVDAFSGLPYPYKPGKCSNNSAKGCIGDEDCPAEDGGAPGLCVLCGSISGGACCHDDGTCDIVPASACEGPGDIYRGDGEPCSRCCGPTVRCRPLTNFEWFDAKQLWPNLDRRDVCRETEEDPLYNCVAWAIDSIDEWIWDEVDLNEDGLWEYSDFEAFFSGYQKSAIIYGSNNNAILHTAKPLPNNCASSKAGGWLRLRHDRNQLEGGYYGDILGTYEY